MLKKYVSKFAMEILPSVAATIIGAYIVNHYIATKPGSEAPVAASVSTAKPKVDVKAKGIAEKGLPEKNAAAEKAVVEKPAEKEKAADKPAETASIPAEPRRHQPTPREKTAVRVIPLTAQPAGPAATPNPAPSVEAAVAPEERRDANDLARAAIDRLRGSEGAP